MRNSLSAFAVILLSCAAPRQDVPVSRAPARDFRVCGEVAGSGGEAPPARSKVVVLWVVAVGTPEEYSFKFGEAPVEDSRFCFTLGAPPKEALNRGHFGLAMLLLVDGFAEVPDGRLPEKMLKRIGSFGLAGDNTLVYVGPELGPGHGWVDQFPVGYSCALVDRSQTSFDKLFTPMSCDSLFITVHDPEEIQRPNWI